MGEIIRRKSEEDAIEIWIEHKKSGQTPILEYDFGEAEYVIYIPDSPLDAGFVVGYCFICGKKISRLCRVVRDTIKGSRRISDGRSGYTTSICGSAECFKIYERGLSNASFTVGPIIEGYCRLCGKPTKINFCSKLYAHPECSRLKGKIKNNLKFRYLPPPPAELPDSSPLVSSLEPRVYLKPWQDPESLFCDTEFLRKLLGKEPAKGEECKE